MGLLEHALACASIGWRVFPCHSVTAAGCTCGDSGCNSPGKHPLTGDGFKSATTDPATIRAWWGMWDWANIAVATGQGLVVLDIDDVTRQDAWPHELRALLSANTPIARTGRAGGDGRHIFCRSQADIGSRAGIWPGVDVRGAGGYVIVAPSAHVSGNFYEWVQDPSFELVELPDELVPFLESRRNEAAKEAPGWLRLSSEQVDEIRSALRVLSSEPREQWLRMCLALRSTGAGEQAFQLWDEWSRTCPEKYDPDVQRATWNSVQEGLPDGSEVTIRTLFGAARAAGWDDKPQPYDPAAPVEADPGIALRVDDLFTMSAEEPAWLIEDVLAVGECAILFGPSSSGKTFVALDICARIVHGWQVWGCDTRKSHVLYLPGEGRIGLRRRLVAWAATRGDLPDHSNLHVAETLPSLATEDGFLRVYATLQRARDEGAPYGLVVIDTLSWAMPGVNENDSGETGAVLARIRRLREEFGTAVLIVHHSGKGGASGMNAARGSSTIVSNQETVLRVAKSGSLVKITVEKVKEGESGHTIERELIKVELGHRPNGKPITSAFLRERKGGDPIDADLTVLLRHLAAFGMVEGGWSGKDLETPPVRPEGIGRNQVRGLVALAVQQGWMATERGERGRITHSLTPDAFRKFGGVDVAETSPPCQLARRGVENWQAGGEMATEEEGSNPS